MLLTITYVTNKETFNSKKSLQDNIPLTDEGEITIPLVGNSTSFRLEFTPKPNSIVRITGLEATACVKSKGKL